MNSSSIGVFIPISEVFPGVENDLATFKSLLQSLSLTDTLFWCARLNNVVSSSSNINHIQRQQFGLNQFFSDEEIGKINAFTQKKGGPQKVTIFFRGQLLELVRWVALYCRDLPEDGTTFEDPEVRRTFAKAALIASDVWANRVFGKRFSLSGGIKTARERALGTMRKGIEAAASSPEISKTLGRGWALFSDYFQRYYPSFDIEFKDSMGLSIEEYYICLCAIVIHYMSPYATSDSIIFDVNFLGQSTPYGDILQKYLTKESQTPNELRISLWGEGDIDFNDFNDVPPYDYRVLRERPILKSIDGRGIILDPLFYSEKASVGPLFHVSGSQHNKIFRAFGYAFENYACDILRRMFPVQPLAMNQRINCNMKVKYPNKPTNTIEIDACLNDVTEIILFEMKAVWIREDEILTDDYENYLKHLREKYGISFTKSGEPKTKGIGQLARMIDLISSEDFLIHNDEFSKTQIVYPVLLVHDPFLSAPLYGNILASEFKAYIKPDAELRSGDFQKGKCRILPLIIMTVEDLENLETSLKHFGLRDLLSNYSRVSTDRIISLHNYIATSSYGNNIYHNQWLAAKTEELIDKTMRNVFPDHKG